MNSTEKFYLVSEERGEPYLYRACGLDNIYLLNGYDVIEDEGERHVSVRNVDELHEAIGLHVICTRKTLSGKEIRFLRNTMDMTQTQLAKILGTTEQTFARWEKGEFEIPGPAERLLRVVFLLSTCPEEQRKEIEQSLKRMIFERMQQLDELDEVRTPMGQFQLHGSWKETHNPCFAYA